MAAQAHEKGAAPFGAAPVSIRLTGPYPSAFISSGTATL